MYVASYNVFAQKLSFYSKSFQSIKYFDISVLIFNNIGSHNCYIYASPRHCQFCT